MTQWVRADSGFDGGGIVGSSLPALTLEVSHALVLDR